MKKLLLTFVPALMLLSSCAGSQPNIELGLFHEDTLAHNEIFGSIQDGLQKSRKNAIDPNYPNVPTLGIQTKEGDGKISIRFIAAVKLRDLTTSSAVWTRTMYDNNGAAFAVNGKTTAEIECKKAYTSVFKNDESYNMSSFDDEQGLEDPSGYTHFVVYTILNIPKEAYKDYFLNTYLSLNGRKTKVVATSVDQTKKYSFSENKIGYLLNKTSESVWEDANKRGDNPSQCLATFADDLSAGDTFTILYNSPSLFKIVKPTLSGTISEGSFSINANGLITVGEGKTDHYALFLTNTNTLEADHKYDVTFKVDFGESELTDARIHGIGSKWSVDDAISLTEIGSTGVYSKTIRLDKGSQLFKFYGSSKWDWDGGANRWLYVNRDETINYTFREGHKHYYLIGKLNGQNYWSSPLHDEYRLSYAKVGSTDVFQINVDFFQADEFQIISRWDTSEDWIDRIKPYGSDNYYVTYAGNYTVYFYTGWGTLDVVSDYFLAGDFNGWTGRDANYKLVQTGFKTYAIEGVYLPGETEIKVNSVNNIWYGTHNPDGGEDYRVFVPSTGFYNIEFSVSAEDHVTITAA